MGSNKSTLLLPPEDVQSICRETGFTSQELQRLYSRFKELDKTDPPRGYLIRADFLNLRGVALNPIGERLIDVILQDHGDTEKINFRQFANFFALFRRHKASDNFGLKEKKLAFLFSLYDRNHDKRIDNDEVKEILKMMVGVNVSDEQLSTIADHTIQELDTNQDSNITFEEFRKTLSQIDVDEKMSMKFST